MIALSLSLVSACIFVAHIFDLYRDHRAAKGRDEMTPRHG